MRMITGFLPPSHGRVRVGGFDLYDHPVQAKQRLGYLPENPPVYPEMTVRRYLRFVAELKDVPSSRLGIAVGLAIERARLGEVADTRIATLSKGFRQRVGLAQAIVHEPPVLVLDEPTSSLDPKQRFEVRELIAELKGRHTVILSTHILPEVSDLADRVFIINRGKVMAVDTPARLGDRLRACETVRVEVEGVSGSTAAACASVEQAFAGLHGARRVTADATAAGTVQARVESEIGVDLRAAAAALVVGHGWRLLGLGGESLSLEDIFLKLTSDDEQRAS
jgi:ABC-2 type transport system ATP-binding protein